MSARRFSACQDATKLFPGVSRFPYQFGRVAMARKDYPAALANYTKAFELGNDLALQALASMYDDGSASPKTRPEPASITRSEQRRILRPPW